ncbi:MAG: hypothetical protein AAB354_05445 [candidate division KSB1 bacterium]
MQTETVRSEAMQLLNKLPPLKLNEALNYLKLLHQVPEEKLDATQEYLETLGWMLLALEAAEQDWE